MGTIVSVMPVSTESVFQAGDRLMALLEQARQEAGCAGVSQGTLARLADGVDTLRSRLVRKEERDLKTLFDLDDRLIELLESAEEAAEKGEVPQELLQEMNDYLEAFRTKVDRIAGYWRWQESIAAICGEEANRLSARKRGAERRVNCDLNHNLAGIKPLSCRHGCRNPINVGIARETSKRVLSIILPEVQF